MYEKSVASALFLGIICFLATSASAQECEFSSEEDSTTEEERDCTDKLAEEVGEYGEAAFKFGYEVGYRDGAEEKQQEQDGGESDGGTTEDLRSGFGEDVDDAGPEETVTFGEEEEDETDSDTEELPWLED